MALALDTAGRLPLGLQVVWEQRMKLGVQGLKAQIWVVGR